MDKDWEEIGSDKPWYALTDDEIGDIRAVLMARFKERYDLIKTLSVNTPLFVDSFLHFFSRNDKQVCDTLLTNTSVFEVKPLSKGAVGVVYSVTGKGMVVVMKQIKGSQPQNLRLRVQPLTPAIRVMTPAFKYYSIKNQSSAEIGISVMAKDDFTNQTIMHCILNVILDRDIHYVHQYDAYWCESGGYNITELANGGDMHEYFTKGDGKHPTPTIIIGALKQLLGVLSILKDDKYSFLHADLKAKNVFVDKRNGPIFKIADFDKSSITMNGYRFYNGSKDYGYAGSFDAPIVSDGTYQPWTLLGKTFQLYTMHTPYGYFMSYDVYTLILSLLAIDDVYEWVKTDPSNPVTQLFTLLFNVNDLAALMAYLAQYPTVQTGFLRISAINDTIQRLNLSFRYCIDDVYTFVGVTPPNRRDTTVPLTVTTTTGGRVCATPCINKTCTTPEYTYLSRTYKWDYC